MNRTCAAPGPIAPWLPWCVAALLGAAGHAAPPAPHPPRVLVVAPVGHPVDGPLFRTIRAHLAVSGIAAFPVVDTGSSPDATRMARLLAAHGAVAAVWVQMGDSECTITVYTARSAPETPAPYRTIPLAHTDPAEKREIAAGATASLVTAALAPTRAPTPQPTAPPPVPRRPTSPPALYGSVDFRGVWPMADGVALGLGAQIGVRATNHMAVGLRYARYAPVRMNRAAYTLSLTVQDIAATWRMGRCSGALCGYAHAAGGLALWRHHLRATTAALAPRSDGHYPSAFLALGGEVAWRITRRWRATASGGLRIALTRPDYRIAYPDGTTSRAVSPWPVQPWWQAGTSLYF